VRGVRVYDIVPLMRVKKTLFNINAINHKIVHLLPS
jgi:hypothetical protein